jgi:hypothetical protein
MLVIKGCLYIYDDDTIVRPEMTGDYWAVDCLEYMKLEEMNERYGDIWHLGRRTIELNGTRYYEGEVSPFETKNLEILTDISKLSLYDSKITFSTE